MTKSKWEKIFVEVGGGRAGGTWTSMEDYFAHGVYDPRFPDRNSWREGNWPGIGFEEGKVPYLIFGEYFKAEELKLFPKKMLVKPMKKNAKLPKRREAHFGVISAKYKKLIETLDPGVHQFIPVAFEHYETGEAIYADTEWFRFNCLHWFEPDKLFDLEAMRKINQIDGQQGMEVVTRPRLDGVTETAYQLKKFESHVWNRDFVEKELKDVSFFQSFSYWPDPQTEIDGDGTFLKDHARKEIKKAGLPLSGPRELKEPHKVLSYFLREEMRDGI